MGIRFQVSGFGSLVWVQEFQDCGFRSRVLCLRFCVSGFRSLGLGFQVSSFRVSGLGSRVLGLTGLSFWGFGFSFRGSGLRYQVSDSGFVLSLRSRILGPRALVLVLGSRVSGVFGSWVLVLRSWVFGLGA